MFLDEVAVNKRQIIQTQVLLHTQLCSFQDTTLSAPGGPQAMLDENYKCVEAGRDLR